MILSVKNLSVRYRNGALGVTDVSFEVDAGQVVLISGPNGAGKTTTVRAASGFLRAEGARIVRGTVQLFGEDTTNSEPQKTASKGLVLVPERQKIFPNMSVMDNLRALGKLPRGARRSEIQDRIYELFPVLGERPREMAGRLSGGQQQMLAIARSLMSEAKLLILDEMTLGLHHTYHSRMFDVVKLIAQEGTGVVIVDESIGSGSSVADYCYLLADGKLEADGPPGSIVRQLA